MKTLTAKWMKNGVPWRTMKKGIRTNYSRKISSPGNFSPIKKKIEFFEHRIQNLITNLYFKNSGKPYFPPKVKFYRNIFDQFFSHNSSELCFFDDKELVPIRWNNWDFSTFFQTFGNDIGVSSNCTRISWRPIFMVPVIDVGDELPQLFIDLEWVIR